MATDRPPLTPETYRTVQAIFFAARERAPQERASFLDSACGTDTVVRAEVDSLLAADERNVDFLEKSALADMDARRSDLRAQLSGALGSRYEILNEIGGGGMSRLFLAQEHAPDRLVVIKVLSRELGAELSTQRFAREIQVAARMQHPNIVPLFVTGEVDGLPYFTMPYVEGKLRDLCAASELVPAQQALRILRDIAKALAFAHGKGIVHRDIKPENVLLASGTAVVTDFGIAKAMTDARLGPEERSRTTQPGISWATPQYMSPEQAWLEPDLDARTDIYSFGVVAYELLGGVHPFAGRRRVAELIHAHTNETPPSLAVIRPELSPQVVEIVARCMAKDRNERFADGGDLLHALEALDAPGTVGPSPTGAMSKALEPWLRGRQLLQERTEGMREALECFEEAIKRDPNFSPAHSGLAYVYFLFGIYHEGRPREVFPRARAAADRALALNATDALALVVRAAVALWFEWDRQGAERLARRAVEHAPDLFLTHDLLGWILASQGRFQEAITAMERGVAVDPLSDYAAYDLGWVLILSGRWEQAIHLMRPAVERHPRSAELRRVFAYALFHSGFEEEATAELRKVLELNPKDRWAPANLAQGLAAIGDTSGARRLVRELEERSHHEPLPAVGLAIAHLWLRDEDKALEWLAKAVDARDYWLVLLRYDPSLRLLRGNPRFEELLEQVGPLS